ncbi:hypothetical protein RhiTH_001443 [Rhizoctonia solani]
MQPGPRYRIIDTPMDDLDENLRKGARTPDGAIACEHEAEGHERGSDHRLASMRALALDASLKDPVA